jgi:serine phosphatase RsbU (regulator of sigma subunit)/uncharacterized protein (UPF0333 family)
MTDNKKTDLARDWPEPKQFKRSIKFEFSLYISIVLLVLMSITGYVITTQYVDTVTQNIKSKLLIQARSYSGPAGKLIISSDNPDVLLLNNICRKLVDDNSEMYWAGIAGSDSTYLAHTDFKYVISSARMPLFASDQSGSDLREGESYNLLNDTIYITVPIKENNLVLGNLRVASSVKPINEARSKSITSVISITAIMLIIELLVTIIILRKKLHPIRIITDRLKEVNFKNIELDIPIKLNNEFGYLSKTLQVMGSKLNLAQKDLLEKERITRELEIAREIQKNILPREYPNDAGFEFSGAYRSAKEVGGDYYDFINIDSNHLGFLVADVSGKSLPGMLVMLLTRDIILRYAHTTTKPALLLSHVNRELMSSIKQGMFVTMLYGVLETQTGNVEFASAGHNPLIKVDGNTGESDLIKTKGYPLGMMSDEMFSKRIETGQINLKGNERLILYTDGVNEAQNINGEEFGMNRLVDAVSNRSITDPPAIVDNTLKLLDSFVQTAQQYDDITILAIKWHEKTTDKNIIDKGAEVNANK